MEDAKPHRDRCLEQLIFIEGYSMLSAGPSIPNELAHVVVMAHWAKDYYYTHHTQPTGLGCVGKRTVGQVLGEQA